MASSILLINRSLVQGISNNFTNKFDFFGTYVEVRSESQGVFTAVNNPNAVFSHIELHAFVTHDLVALVTEMNSAQKPALSQQ